MGKGITLNNNLPFSGMKNDFTTVFDEPVGNCLQNKGMNDCSKWPNMSPCCWLSCSEPCGAACWKANRKYGEECEFYGGEHCASESAS